MHDVCLLSVFDIFRLSERLSCHGGIFYRVRIVRRLEELREVRETHVALAEECVVECQSCTHVLRLVAHRSELEVFAQQGTVVGVCTVVDNLFCTAEWTLSTEIGEALFRYDEVHIMFCGVDMGAHRHDGADSSTLCR